MDETRKANLSNKMKSRWNEAREYASILYIPEIEIYNYYLDICRKYKDYLLDPNKRDLFIEACFNEIEEKREYKEEKNEAVKWKKVVKKEIENKEPVNDLKLMLWVIDKIGSLDKAEKVFRAAKMAMEMMES
jgi:hypothetical protein